MTREQTQLRTSKTFIDDKSQEIQAPAINKNQQQSNTSKSYQIKTKETIEHYQTQTKPIKSQSNAIKNNQHQ